MTREQIEAEYTVKNGIIQNPGKFESEPLWVVDFWDASFDGYSEDLADMETHGYFACLVVVEPQDRVNWPELDKATTHILLLENGQGFVSCEELTGEQVEKIRADFEQDSEQEESED